MSDPKSPLSRADLTWLESITLDADTHVASVKLNVPVDPTAGTADFEEEIDFDGPVPEYLASTAREFAFACVSFVRERGATRMQSESKCVTCTGACCARVFSEVHVTADDLVRMGIKLVQRGVDKYPYGASWNGYAGTLKRVIWKGEGEATFEDDEQPMACVFLDVKTSACSIYAERPKVCREYTAHDCVEHEQASSRLVMLRRKKFVEP